MYQLNMYKSVRNALLVESSQSIYWNSIVQQLLLFSH